MTLQDQYLDGRSARDAGQTSLDLARQRYKAGEDDLLALLRPQSACTNADRSAAQARETALASYATLVKAWGSGWVSVASAVE